MKLFSKVGCLAIDTLQTQRHKMVKRWTFLTQGVKYSSWKTFYSCKGLSTKLKHGLLKTTTRHLLVVGIRTCDLVFSSQWGMGNRENWSYHSIRNLFPRGYQSWVHRSRSWSEFKFSNNATVPSKWYYQSTKEEPCWSWIKRIAFKRSLYSLRTKNWARV